MSGRSCRYRGTVMRSVLARIIPSIRLICRKAAFLFAQSKLNLRSGNWFPKRALWRSANEEVQSHGAISSGRLLRRLSCRPRSPCRLRPPIRRQPRSCGPPLKKFKARLENWAQTHRNILRLEVLGKTAQGRPLYAIASQRSRSSRARQGACAHHRPAFRHRTLGHHQCSFTGGVAPVRRPGG